LSHLYGEALCTERSNQNRRLSASPFALRVAFADILTRVAAELALFAGAGFLLFAINDVLVDLIYFARQIWRGMAVYSRYPRAFASYFLFKKDPGFLAVLVPAWDESAVIARVSRVV